MTDQNPNDPSQSGGEPFADEPIPEDGPAAGTEGGASARGREWLSQLETMIQDIATQAAPVARQVAAKAAELTAVAAIKAGPLAQKAADATTDAGQKLAERAQSLASELRSDGGTPAEDVAWDTTTDPTDSAASATSPDATFGDTADASSGGMAPGTFEDETRPGGTL